MQRWRVSGALLTGGAVLCAWSGCTATKQTELVPGMETQIQVPKDLLSVRIDVQAEGETASCIIHSVNPANPGFITLPRTLGVVPGAGPGRAVTITVTGFSRDEGDVTVTQDCATPVQGGDGKYDANVRVLRRSRLTYVGDQVLFLPMNLHFACYDAAACSPTQTCKAGQCVDDTVDPTALPPYSDAMTDGTSNTCFSTKQCFGDEQPAKAVDQSKCVYGFTQAPPAALAKGLNVRVFYDHDGGESEVLDADKDEGFTVDPTNPQQVILAPGLCNMVNGTGNPPHAITQVNVASLCPPKGVYQPICSADAAPGAPVPLPDGGTSADGGCNVAHPLVPAPSALYVLMDDSSTMAGFFGTQGLQTVTGLTLGDPVFRNADIGFTLLPHQGADCVAATDSVATPLVPFGLAATVQAPVATIIGDPSKVLVPDAKWYVDAALRPNGAYGALQALAASKGVSFNRMAVLLIANRTAAQDCGIGAPASEAAAALAGANPIYTYVVALNAMASYDTTELGNIATSGGTTLFDATADATVGARAFNTVETDLGSCLYEKPTGVDTSAMLQYTDPILFQTAKVTFDGTCSATAPPSANGWNFDGARLRICGQACTNLRTVLATTADAFLAQGKSAPDVPVVALEACATSP